MLFKKKIELFFFNFEKALNSIDSVVANQLFKIIVKILDRFISSDEILRKNQLLLGSIRKLLNKELTFLKELHFQIHPKDKELIQKHFKNFIKCYNWIFICNPKILRGECKIISKQGMFDIKTSKYWKMLYQIIKVKSI
ncbi:hypothetical protein HIC20_02860 [Buchnera aphidicola (Hormaphis cornu)]|nr:hypothetical protein HIC20_02860 [Buchnera aphidicola (Hormaphis cornu)]